MSAILSDMDRHAAMDDCGDWALHARQTACCATLGCLGNCMQGRKACQYPEAASAVSEFCAPDDDQTQSADLLVIKWMAQASLYALAIVASVFTLVQLGQGFCPWFKELLP